MVKVVEPFKVFVVPVEVDEEERKLIKFAKKSVPYCNPGAGYTYYEFIGSKYINSNRNIMALSKVPLSLLNFIHHGNLVTNTG